MTISIFQSHLKAHSSQTRFSLRKWQVSAEERAQSCQTIQFWASQNSRTTVLSIRQSKITITSSRTTLQNFLPLLQQIQTFINNWRCLLINRCSKIREKKILSNLCNSKQCRCQCQVPQWDKNWQISCRLVGVAEGAGLQEILSSQTETARILESKVAVLSRRGSVRQSMITSSPKSSHL